MHALPYRGWSSCASTHSPKRPQRLAFRCHAHNSRNIGIDLISCHGIRGQDQAAQYVRRRACTAAVLLSAVLVLQPVLPSAAADRGAGDSSPGSIPEDLRSTDTRGPSLGQLLRGPKTEEITRCTRKCMPACIRGGEGAPGLGPLTVRKDLVKFKDGFRTRSYCLSECTQVCAASITGVPAAPISDK